MDNPMDLPQPHLGQEPGVVATVRAVVSLLVGVAAGFGCSSVLSWRYSVSLGWMMGAAVFVAWMWITIWPMDAPTTAKHAVREDPGRAAADILVLLAALASLAAVGLLLLETATGSGERNVQATMTVGSVALAWASVHTVFTTRYARIYYAGPDEGVDFNEDDPPCYSDFAYLAFTIGMTFQVSDTDLKTKEIRATALRHALLSYLFGAVIIAAMINLVVSLSSR